MIAVEVVLNDFHRLKLLEAGFFGDFVFAVIGVVFEMADVGDVSDVADFVSEMIKVPEKHVERNGGARMSEMRIAVYGGAADVEACQWSMERDEGFFFPA
jgi:hypothetical protein